MFSHGEVSWGCPAGRGAGGPIDDQSEYLRNTCREVISPKVVFDGAFEVVPREGGFGDELSAGHVGPCDGRQQERGLSAAPVTGDIAGEDGSDPDVVLTKGHLLRRSIGCPGDGGFAEPGDSRGDIVDLNLVLDGSGKCIPGKSRFEREGIGGREDQPDSGEFSGSHVDDCGRCSDVVTVQDSHEASAALVVGQCGLIDSSFVDSQSEAATVDGGAAGLQSVSHGQPTIDLQRAKFGIQCRGCGGTTDQIAIGVGNG